MYKLLIVDDECMITDLLCEYLVNRLEGEVEVLKAYTSRGAVEIFKDSRVDILLTDINMPVMNGLELHKFAIESNSCCKVIFLTGDNDIKNMQYALRNESVDFILKTEGNEVIIESIKRAILTLENELSTERLLSRAQEQLMLCMPLMQERLILELLNGEKFDPNSFNEVNFPLDINNKILLLLGRIDNSYSITNNTRYRLKNLVDSVISEEYHTFSVIGVYDILWLIQPKLNGIEKIREDIQSCMDDVQQICQRAFNVSISLALSKDFINFEEISPTWLALKQTIKSLYGISDGMLLIENKICNEQSDESAEWLYVKNILQNIQLSIDNLQWENYENQYKKLSIFLQKDEGIAPARKMEVLMRLYLAFLSNENDNGQSSDISFAWRLSDGDNWETYDRIFRNIAADFFSRQNQSSFKKTNQLLRIIKEYIDSNLSGDLSLNHLAKIVNFSPSYLSRLFKQVTNVSLTDYIGQLKCKHAKSMLIESDMKVVDIALSLGFDTPSYFTRFFKKYTGMGPQEYRESVMTKKDNQNKKR